MHGMAMASPHHYDIIYQKYIAPLRCHSNISFLEIGLGCGMPYGEGHSLTIWMEYLPYAERIVEVEYQLDCLRALEKNWHETPAKWVTTSSSSWAAALKNVKFVHGDQMSEESLRGIGEKYGPFDVTIDDGGHMMIQQILTIATLWPFIKPGGIHVVEDLQTSTDATPTDLGMHPITAVQYITKLQEALHHPRHSEGLDPAAYIGFTTVLGTLESVHCFPEACVLVKRP
jgi:hypothetical protein